MASTIHRGRRYDFDDEYCRCQDNTEDTSGHNAKCPICVPEMFTDPDRLLAWFNETTDLTVAAHVYQVAAEWLDPEEVGVDPAAIRLRTLIDTQDWKGLEPWMVPAAAGTPIRERRLTAEATRLLYG